MAAGGRRGAALPKDEAKAGGVALSAEIMFWRKGAKDARWPALAQAAKLAREKFADPKITAAGERRARVALDALRTLWINTGTLCNLSCENCYIESTPRNDRLVYITAEEARAYFDEIARDRLPTREIGFTGGEPFLNPHAIEMMEDALSRGFDVLMLTNAMKPMRRYERELIALNERFGARLTMRVSDRSLHAAPARAGTRTAFLDADNRGPAMALAQWFQDQRRRPALQRRVRTRGARGLRAPVRGDRRRRRRARSALRWWCFPEMDASVDVPEITEACWGILGKSPSDVMCATSRMVVKRKGAERPSVQACTLLAYDERFETGRTLREASGPVSLNHPHCAKFCVLGGAACSR